MRLQQQKDGRYGPDIFNQILSLQSIFFLLASTDLLKRMMVFLVFFYEQAN